MKNQIKNMKEPNFENILFTMANYIIKKTRQ